jgi:hypothetical protein
MQKRLGIAPAYERPIWLQEGFACYYECARWIDTAPEGQTQPTWELQPMTNPVRTAVLKWLPVWFDGATGDQLLKMNIKEVGSLGAMWYTLGWALFAYLMDGDDRAYREKLVSYYKLGRKDDADLPDFQTHFGLTPDAAKRAALAYVRALPAEDPKQLAARYPKHFGRHIHLRLNDADIAATITLMEDVKQARAAAIWLGEHAEAIPAIKGRLRIAANSRTLTLRAAAALGLVAARDTLGLRAAASVLASDDRDAIALAVAAIERASGRDFGWPPRIDADREATAATAAAAWWKANEATFAFAAE